jgi:hypothetical protein
MWNDKRYSQLRDLETLIRDVSCINEGNNFVGRIEKCITLADELSRSDIVAGEHSFISFLNGLATDASIKQAKLQLAQLSNDLNHI